MHTAIVHTHLNIAYVAGPDIIQVRNNMTSLKGWLDLTHNLSVKMRIDINA